MKKKYIYLILTVITLLFTIRVDAKVLDTGDDVTVKGTYEKSHFAFGNKIDSKASVDGLSLVAGNELDIENHDEIGAYAGNNLTINSKIDKDLFVAGNYVNIGSDAKLGRDVYIASNSAKINSDIKGNLYILSGSVDLTNIRIKGNVYTIANSIDVNSKTKIDGKLVYNDTTDIPNLKKASIGKTEIKKTDNKNVLLTTLNTFLNRVLSSFIILLVLIIVFPRLIKKLRNFDIHDESIPRHIIVGLAIIILVPIIAVLLIFTGVLAPLSIITLALWGIAVYMSNIIAAYILGNNVLKNKNVPSKRRSIEVSLIGVLILYIIELIPIFGNIISMLAMSFGVGYIYSLFKKFTKSA